MGEAVDLVAKGTAPMIPQTEEGATYDPMLNKKELQKIDWSKPAKQIHNFIRGMDSTPGAWTTINDEEVRLFGSSLWNSDQVPAHEIQVNVENRVGIVHEGGLLINAVDDRFVNVERIKIGTRTIPASKYGQKSEDTVIQFTEEELATVDTVRNIWTGILNMDVDNDTDFFACGTWKNSSVHGKGNYSFEILKHETFRCRGWKHGRGQTGRGSERQSGSYVTKHRRLHESGVPAIRHHGDPSSKGYLCLQGDQIRCCRVTGKQHDFEIPQAIVHRWRICEWSWKANRHHQPSR